MVELGAWSSCTGAEQKYEKLKSYFPIAKRKIPTSPRLHPGYREHQAGGISGATLLRLVSPSRR